MDSRYLGAILIVLGLLAGSVISNGFLINQKLAAIEARVGVRP